jgi:hypothetical protein
MSIPNLPAQIANSTNLAMAIYSQWRINMINAKVAGAMDWPTWADMDGATKDSFVHAVQTEAVDVVKFHQANIELEYAFTPSVGPRDPDPTPPSRPSRPTGPIPCYTCGKVKVDFPGGTCEDCTYLIGRMNSP